MSALRAPATILSSVTQAILEEAELRAVPRERVLRAVGVTGRMLTSREERIPRDVDAAVWREIVRATGEPDLGLTLAQADSTSRAYGLVGFLAMTSETLGEAFTRVARYHPLLKDDIVSRVFVRDGDFHLEDRLPASREISDFGVGSYIALARRWSDGALVPRSVSFQHARPKDARGYERLFRCPVHFGQPCNGFVLSAEQAAAPMRAPQPEVARYLARMAESELARLPGFGPDGVTSQVLAALRGALAEAGDLRLSKVARRLGVSARTLQRRLREQGADFQQLLEDVRRTEGIALITESDLPLEIVAERLGYADSKSFRRAVRRWTGSAPVTLRRRLAPSNPLDAVAE